MKLDNKHLSASDGMVLTNGKIYAKQVFVTKNVDAWKEVSESDTKYIAFVKMQENRKKKEDNKHDFSR